MQRPNENSRFQFMEGLAEVWEKFCSTHDYVIFGLEESIDDYESKKCSAIKIPTIRYKIPLAGSLRNDSTLTKSFNIG